MVVIVRSWVVEDDLYGVTWRARVCLVYACDLLRQNLFLLWGQWQDGSDLICRHDSRLIPAENRCCQESMLVVWVLCTQ